MMNSSIDDDDKVRGSAKSGSLKDDEKEKQLEEFEETIPAGESPASSHDKKKKRQTAHSRRQEQQQAEENFAVEEQKEEEREHLVAADDADQDTGALSSSDNADAAGAAGAFAISQGGREVRRGRNADYNVSLLSMLDTIRSDDPTPPPQDQEQSAHTDNGDTPLVVAQLAEEAEDVTALRQEFARLEAGIHQAQVVEGVPADDNGVGGQNDQAKETTRVGKDDENSEEELRYKRRKWFIVLGVVVLAIAAIVGIAVGVSSGGSGDNSSGAPGTTTSSKEASGLVMNLVGISNEFDEDDSELWATATKAFVENYYNTRRRRRGLVGLPLRILQVSNVQDVVTTIQVTNTAVVQDGNGGEPSIQIVYNQAVTYALDSSGKDVSMDVIATEPFKTSALRLAYVNDLQSAGENVGSDTFDNLIGASEVSTSTANPTPSPTNSIPVTEPPTQDPITEPPTAVIPTNWNPLGQILNGKADEDYFGQSVSLSHDGSVMAIGADQVDSSNPGYVVVQRYNQTTRQWTQIGQDMIGQAGGDSYGKSVSLNGNGTILAVGAVWNDSGGEDAGHVRVFSYNSFLDRWVQLGSDIVGEGAGDWSGFSVSLSDAGDILAVGAQGDDTENGDVSGSARLFQYDHHTSSWVQLGQKLIGQAAGDLFGISVSLNAQGTIVGVGADDNDSGGVDAGQVSVYEYNSSSSTWDPLGDPINGRVAEGWFGYSVSLDDSGLILAVGAYGVDERVLVYSYDRATSKWNQRGQTLLTQQPSNDFGLSVSLSGNGNVLAVGSDSHDDNGMIDMGQVRIFQYDTTTSKWNQVGDPLNGESEDDEFGRSVSLSSDGRVVGVGVPGAYVNGSDSGSAYAFTLNNN